MVVDWDAEHQALAGLGGLQALGVASTTELGDGGWGAPIVLAASGHAAFPLLIAGERDGRRTACLGADLGGLGRGRRGRFGGHRLRRLSGRCRSVAAGSCIRADRGGGDRLGLAVDHLLEEPLVGVAPASAKLPAESVALPSQRMRARAKLPGAVAPFQAMRTRSDSGASPLRNATAWIGFVPRKISTASSGPDSWCSTTSSKPVCYGWCGPALGPLPVKHLRSTDTSALFTGQTLHTWIVQSVPMWRSIL